jgi:GNAT superfamily N-acetyltransferase
MTDLPFAVQVEENDYFRIFAIRIPANDCCLERVLVFAMPAESSSRIQVIAQLTMNAAGIAPTDTVDWIQVETDYRRQGIGRMLWEAAEKIRGSLLECDPVTPLGEIFAKSLTVTQRRTPK